MEELLAAGEPVASQPEQEEPVVQVNNAPVVNNPAAGNGTANVNVNMNNNAVQKRSLRKVRGGWGIRWMVAEGNERGGMGRCDKEAESNRRW